jgi:hypothetical protein
MRPDSYLTFVAGHRRVSLVVRAANLQSDPDIREGMLRGAVVVLTGHFEAFLNSLGMLLADLIVADWDAMLPAQRRIVARYAARELRSGLANVPVDQFPDDGAADAMRNSVRTSHAWMEAGGEFSRTGPNLRVEQLYHLETAPAAVERFLASYWPDGPTFFDWMDSLGHDRGALWVTLTQLINVRNDIAHGLGQVPAPTHEDLRLYLARSAHLVRLAIRFCEAAGTPPAA